MNSTQMVEQIEVLRDMYKAPYFDPTEYEVFINSAISAFVSRAIPSDKGENYVKHIEGQKTWDQISTLVTPASITGVNIISGVGATNVLDYATAYVEKPSDYWFYYFARVKLNGKFTKVIPMSYSEINNAQEDGFNYPDDDNVLSTFVQNKIVICSKTIPTEVRLYYIAKPTKVQIGVTNCNLPESTHDEICHMAVQLSCGGTAAYELYKVQENEINKR
jgi:hypothetical protein